MPLFDISLILGVFDTEIHLKTRTRRTLEGDRQWRGQGREPPQASDADTNRPYGGLRYGDPPEDEDEEDTRGGQAGAGSGRGIQTATLHG